MVAEVAMIRLTYVYELQELLLLKLIRWEVTAQLKEMSLGHRYNVQM